MLRALKFKSFFTDFDNTILNGTIQYSICEILPSQQLAQVRRLVDLNLQEHALQLIFNHCYDKGLSIPQCFHSVFDKLQFNEGALSLLKFLKELNIPVSIISGSNSYLVSHYLKHKGYQTYFKSVIANPFKLIEGQLYCIPYDTFQVCSLGLCNRIICKGKRLEEALQQSKGPAIYMGDGSNDFCPSYKLDSESLAFWRKDFEIEQMAKQSPSLEKPVKAKLQYYRQLREVEEYLRQPAQ